MAARCISSASSRSIPRARVATPRRRRFAATSLFKKVRFGRENRDDSYRNTDLLKAIFCAFFDATVGVAHSETVDIDGGAAAMERASAARARERLRRAFAAMRLEAVENEDDYAVYLADPGLDALECDGTAVIVLGAAVPACAAFLGDLELLRLALELGYEWNWETCCCAALNGHLECLKYARERGCDWSEVTCGAAAENGHLDCLKYAHENGCPWDKRTCDNAARYGHLDCLEYAHENGCPWNWATCDNAARYGHLDCLEYAHENGCPWDEVTCEEAAYYGHLECLKYARENGCPWDKQTCDNAAYYGHLDCLRYAHENGCPWNEVTCKDAAENGHLECLKYACAHGCPGSDRYAEALNEVVIPDVDESFGVDVALAFQQNGGEISMREFLPLWVAHREGYRDAHLEIVRNWIAHD
jgi:hypothetical protein